MSELKNLLPNTEKVLRQLAKLPLLQDFTFVGGSALAVYMGHRLSKDIDTVYLAKACFHISNFTTFPTRNQNLE